LGQVTGGEIIKVIIVSAFWLVIFYYLARRTWQRGLKAYAVYGG